MGTRLKAKPISKRPTLITRYPYSWENDILQALNACHYGTIMGSAHPDSYYSKGRGEQYGIHQTHICVYEIIICTEIRK